MSASSPYTERLVSSLAIHSKLDLVFKFMALYAFFLVLVGVLENTMMPPEDRQSILELAPMMAVSALILGSVFFSVVTHQHRLQQRLKALAMTDSLTNLPNRRAFIDSFNKVQADAASGYLLLIDADHFKRINDTYGHAAGDACLVAIADKLRSVCAPDDFAGRLGGEEFGLFLSGMSDSRRKLVSQTLVRPIRVALENRDSPVKISFTLSVGQTELAPSLPFETLMHRADVALFSAKSRGRACARQWTPDLEQAS